MLERLVALNARRAAEEAAGTVRWLRPSFQDPAQRQTPEQTALPLPDTTPDTPDPTDASTAPAAAAAVARQPWPATLPAQMRAVADALAASPAPLSEQTLAERFSGKGPWKKGLPQIILQTLHALGRAQTSAQGLWRGV